MLQSSLGQQSAPIGQGYLEQMLSSCHMPGVASSPLQSSHHLRHQKIMKAHLQGCTLSGRQLTCVTVREKARKFKILQGTKLSPVIACLNKLNVINTRMYWTCRTYLHLSSEDYSLPQKMLNTNLTNVTVMHTEKIPK